MRIRLLIVSLAVMVGFMGIPRANDLCYITYLGNCRENKCKKCNTICDCKPDPPPQQPKPVKPQPTKPPTAPPKKDKVDPGKLGTLGYSSLNSGLAQTAGAPFFFTPGNQFVGASFLGSGFGIQYDSRLGGQWVPLSNPNSFAVGIRIIGPQPTNPNFIDFELASFHVTFPSYICPVTGEDTGPITMTLDLLNPDTTLPAQGMINTQTGQFAVPVEAWFMNDQYPPWDPAYLTMELVGTIDRTNPSSPQISISSIDPIIMTW